MNQHVFIAYIPSDHIYARKFVDHLLAQGFNVWLDDSSDESADHWEVITSAIEQAAAFVILMSREAQTAPHLMKAIGAASQHKKALLPVLLSGEKWSLFMGTPFEDVRQGQLPSTTFIERLTQQIKPEADKGQDVTQSARVTIDPGIDNPALTTISRPTEFRQLTDALRSALDTLPTRSRDETQPKDPKKAALEATAPKPAEIPAEKAEVAVAIPPLPDAPKIEEKTTSSEVTPAKPEETPADKHDTL